MAITCHAYTRRRELALVVLAILLMLLYYNILTCLLLTIRMKAFCCWYNVTSLRSSLYYHVCVLSPSSIVYQYKHSEILFLCGDFNSRCGDNDDFIRVIDEICDREVIGFNLNKYGVLLYFLNNVNMYMLNGKSSTSIEFTQISTRSMISLVFPLILC